MNNHQAIIVGSDSNSEAAPLAVLADVERAASSSNSNEKSSNNHEKTLQQKFFKEIATHIVNATHVHVTGTGQVQEQCIRYLAATPQFKNSITSESTLNEMSDEDLADYITSKL